MIQLCGALEMVDDALANAWSAAQVGFDKPISSSPIFCFLGNKEGAVTASDLARRNSRRTNIGVGPCTCIYTNISLPHPLSFGFFFRLY